MNVFVLYGNEYVSYDIYPNNTAFYLRRLLAEDHHVAEARLHIHREGVEIDDETVLQPFEVVQITIENISSKKRRIGEK